MSGAQIFGTVPHCVSCVFKKQDDLKGRVCNQVCLCSYQNNAQRNTSKLDTASVLPRVGSVERTSVLTFDMHFLC